MLIQAVVCVWLIPGRDLPMFNMEEIILFLSTTSVFVVVPIIQALSVGSFWLGSKACDAMSNSLPHSPQMGLPNGTLLEDNRSDGVGGP